jgi:hypothetical protein
MESTSESSGISIYRQFYSGCRFTTKAPPKTPVASRGLVELEQKNSRLRKELAETKLARDILKKATANFARESPIRVHETVVRLGGREWGGLCVMRWGNSPQTRIEYLRDMRN